ncbi:MAG: NAD(P)/FAD-dependent oxidoreductase [Halieaceae bacterium]|nr:MAG: NAD(P)/FAD-dependent oxidoreductase [Halieaceae bacterium]
MTKQIKRRDFVSGVAIGAGGLLLAGCTDDRPVSFANEVPRGGLAPSSGSYYPPTLTGMRGSHDGSYEVAHALSWRGEKPADYQLLEEHYDLVVVGAGMSGLAAAHFYREKMGPEARILILDNHDDFGGHAKRNEFHRDGRMMVSLGGAQNIESVTGYSDAATKLMEDIGLNEEFLKFMDVSTSENLALVGNFDANNGVALPGSQDHFIYAGNWNAVMFGGEGYEQVLESLPLPGDEREKLITFWGGNRDFLEGLSLSEKWEYLNTVSYNQFLIDKVGLLPTTVPILNAIILHLSGMTGWNLTVGEALLGGASGIKSLGWLGKATAAAGGAFIDRLLKIRMFPDGNASVARLLVQKLIPTVAPEVTGPDSIVGARFNYEALDEAGNDTRLRLNSTAVGIRENQAGEVEIDYVEQGSAKRVLADHCILACYNGLIPHLCPEMPESQKTGLAYGVKTPFVYANVQVRDGKAFSKAGATLFQCPYDPFQWVSCAPTVAVGGFEPPRGPDDPMVIFMMHSPMPMTKPDPKLSTRDQLRLARTEIYQAQFSDYEQQIREQLQSMLGQFGFQHQSDIEAITVNRIPHGYAYPYVKLDDPDWEAGQAPHEIGRAQFGRISVANSDSEAVALMNAAFDAAYRAVEEQTA